MKITNVRAMNNYKIKLINAKLSGVNVTQESVAEQGTRTPIPQTPPTQAETATQKFDRVMNYLIGRYEPGWSASDPAVGRAAVMASMGLSAGINPLIAGGTLEYMFNGLTNTDAGYFDALTHPKDFAAEVKKAYKVFERARKPIQAKHRFMDYSSAGIGNYSYLDDGGNAFFGSEKNMLWYPEPDSTNYNNYDYRYSYKGYAADYANGIERYMLHSPYGIFRSPMFQPAGYNVGKTSIPWMTDRYAPNAGWVFDAYLKLREETTLRDLLNDNRTVRDPLLGVLVDGVTDTYLNSYYSGNCYPAGLYSRGIESNLPIINRDQGGYGANAVRIGKPWIPYPNGITWRGNLGLLADGGATLNFNAITLVMTDGSLFPNNPPPITDLNVDYASGISYGNGQTRLDRLNALADAWGNSMEFTLYSGLLPYGGGYEQYMPFMLYKDPTIPENVRYMRWRMDASMSHWKEKFKSPIDGFAHVMTDSLVAVERTYHQWTGPTFASWSNVLPGGTSWVENIPVAWGRDQFNYTYGPSAGTGKSGIVWGAELFGWYDWNARADQKKSPTDSNPIFWVLDEDIASPLYTSIYDLVVGQRFNGLAKASSIWGMGVCGTSTLGELYTICKLEDKRTPDGYPFFYNTFIGMDATNNNLLWKGVPGTSCDWSGSTVTPSGTVPWCNDRRFRLFYLYPLALALGGTVVDQMHNGYAYYGVNGWFDIRLPATNGVHIFHGDQEAHGIGTIVSDFPHPGRRTANTPPQNFWTGIARTSEFELLYACMKGGLTAGLDSLGFTKLYSELLAGNSDVTPRSGYYRALEYTLSASSYFEPGIEIYPSIVPIIRTQQSVYRGMIPGYTGGLPDDQFRIYSALALSIPVEKRVVIPTYWLLDGPPEWRDNDYYFKQTADGTTYTILPGLAFVGPTFTNADTTPLKFTTPWAYVNRQYASESFRNFLNQSKAAGIYFNTINDDCESTTPFVLGGEYTSFEPVGNNLMLRNYALNNTHLEIPDARRIPAIVADARYTGITNSITQITMADEYAAHYASILDIKGLLVPEPIPTEPSFALQTAVTNRNTFPIPWNNTDFLYQMYAWNAAIHTFCAGDLRAKIIGKSLEETDGFRNVTKCSADVYPMNISEAIYATDQNGHFQPKIYIPGYASLIHSYGELFSGIISNYGYPAVANDQNRYGTTYGWHPIASNGISFGCPPYQAMINDVRRVRGVLRSRPEAYQDGIAVWVVGGIDDVVGVPATQFKGTNQFAEEYYLEQIYHLCLNGINRINVFNPGGSVHLLHEALENWKTISGNTLAIPCSNGTGSTGDLVERIDLRKAGTNQVISGGYMGDPNTRLWRITVPPGKNQLVKGSTTQPTLPSNIPIPSGSRGVWLTAPASYGMPNYSSS